MFFFSFIFIVLEIFKTFCFDRELYSNQISGKIPEELGNLTDLVSLDLYLNNLTGTIPSTLSKLQKLRFLYDHLSFILRSKSVLTFLFAFTS